MSQNIPQKPASLTDDEWNFVLKRDKYQCALRDQCKATGLLGQSDYCSQQLHTDHHQPQHLGGDDSWVNLRLLCEGPNCGRPVEPTGHWATANIWDEKIVPEQLRQIQRIAGYDAILNTSVKNALVQFRNELLQRITLLPGVTGIGKAVMMESVLFAINEVVNEAGAGRPRARNVLWLATDRTLRDLAVIELAQDIYNYGIVTKRPPSVVAFDGYGDFQAGPGDHDICVSCPHILWDVDDNRKEEGKRRSDDEVREALKWFDVIVFDEGDWAAEQVRRLAMLASHALKFALTASPPIIPGINEDAARTFLRRFVLVSNEAIADYRRALDMDACLKFIDVNDDLGFIRTSEHDQYEALISGCRNLVDAKASLDHPVFIATILQAIHDADRCESRMRERSPDNYYSPHIIARFDRIEDAVAAYYVLNHILPGQPLANPGWNVTVIFRNHVKRLKLSADEAELSGQKSGKWRHPFMRAKNNRGVADAKCSRVLLICQIGVRGINDWPIQSAVDCTEMPSSTDVIQFDFGRPIRLPKHLAHFLFDNSLRQFVTSRLYIPAVDNLEDKERQIRLSRNFLLNMQEQIAGRGFQTWADIIAGESAEAIPAPDNSAAAIPFTQQDRLMLQNNMGRAIGIGSDLNDEELNRIVASLVPEASGARRTFAERYVKRLRDDPVFRNDQVLASNAELEAQVKPEIVVTQLRAQDTYSVDILVRFVKSDARFDMARQKYLDDIQAGSVTVIDSLSHLLRSAQLAYYREPPVIWRLQGEGGVIPVVAGELAHILINAGALDVAHRGWVHTAMSIVAAKFFDVDDAQEGRQMDHHAYHVAILGRCRHKLQDLARGYLVKKGILRNIAHLATWKG